MKLFVAMSATPGDFSAGDSVLYVPRHAHGDRSHPHCERGIVSSTNEKFVFVRYYRNGVLQTTAQATDTEDLRK